MTQGHRKIVSTIDATSTDPLTNALLRIVSAIETATTLDELLLLTLNEFADLLNVTFGAVVKVNEDGDSTRVISTYPPRVSMPDPEQLSATPYLQKAIDTRKSIQIDDINQTDLHSLHIELLRNYNIRSALIVPLVAQDRVTALLTLGSANDLHNFTESTIALARMLAGQLAAAITSFVLTDAAQRRSAELATLNDISSAVTSSLDTKEIYHLVVQKLNEYFRVEAGSLLMRHENTGELEFVMTLEGGEEKLAGVIIPRGQGVVGYVAENQRYAIVSDPQHDPRFYSKISEKTGYTTRSILCVPMNVKGRTIGVIELLNKRDGDFTEEDAERLMRMATTIGVAIENARLFQQVANGRDRLEAVLNSNKDGILMAETNGVVMIANPRATQILNRPQDELLGLQLSELLSQLRAQAIDITTPPWLNEHNNTYDLVELELSAPHHSFIRQISLPVRDTIGTIIGQLTILQDISGERELAQLRDDYTGMLVHDLRAPLTAIMNGITMVRRGLGGPISPQQDELLSIAYQSSQSMLEMVNTLLDISKMEQGHMTLNIEDVSPFDIIEEALSRLQASATDHQITLVQQVPDNLPNMQADREKALRILQNLIDNSIKFTPHGCEIATGVAYLRTNTKGTVLTDSVITFVEIPVTVPAVGKGEWLLFWVSDQGPGIPPQYQERIFEKFGQIRGRKVRGTGLGLTFCKLATESHGGQIWLESIEGDGTTFAFLLPLRQSG